MLIELEFGIHEWGCFCSEGSWYSFRRAKHLAILHAQRVGVLHPRLEVAQDRASRDFACSVDPWLKVFCCAELFFSLVSCTG